MKDQLDHMLKVVLFVCFSQLYELTSLFSSVDVGDYISPLAFGMAMDKVAEVRHAAIKAVSLERFSNVFLSIVFFKGEKADCHQSNHWQSCISLLRKHDCHFAE
jgi:hypothetical protein